MENNGSLALPCGIAESAGSGGAAVVMICLPCLLVGGTEIHTHTLARCLQAAGYRVIICCYFEYEPATVDLFRNDGLQVELLGLDRARPRGKMRGLAALSFALLKCFGRYRPQVAHIQYMAPGAVPVLLARAARVPVVLATIHVTANHYGKRAWLPRRIAAPLCDAFVCVSRVAEKSFFGSSEVFSETTRSSGRRHFTITNCVDLQTVDSVRSQGPDPILAAALSLQERLVVGILGRLDRFKGHDLLLEAFARVRQTVPNAVLLCVGAGGGEWPERLIDQAVRLGLQEHVIWTGGMPQFAAFRHLMLMDVVVMPSRPGLEGFGLAAAEAMAFGKPVIASDVDGLAEAVGREGDGRLVPPNDIDALAQAIGELLLNESGRKAIGAAGRRRVQRLYSMEVFAERHHRLYRSLIEALA